MALPTNGKLVRDEIPAIIRNSGTEPEFFHLEPADIAQALRLKLLEEAHELAEAQASEVLDELADVLEVLLAISDCEAVTWDEVVEHASKKRQARGGFRNGVWLLPNS